MKSVEVEFKQHTSKVFFKCLSFPNIVASLKASDLPDRDASISVTAPHAYKGKLMLKAVACLDHLVGHVFAYSSTLGCFLVVVPPSSKETIPATLSCLERVELFCICCCWDVFRKDCWAWVETSGDGAWYE